MEASHPARHPRRRPQLPGLPEGSRRWDERVYHPAPDGQLRSLAQLWTSGHAPAYLAGVIAFVRLLGAPPVSGSLRLAWNDSTSMRAALAGE